MSLINIKNLTFAYPGSYDNIFTDVSLALDTDWRLGFCGRNGRGKTTFLRLLCGGYEYSGSILTSVEFDYFPPGVSNPQDNTRDVLAELAPEAELWQLQKELSKLAVDEGALYRPFNTLSNGEQTKALLAGLFLRENNFLLIDEPTNHLDMEARKIVARYLKAKPGFILVSHDRAFLDECVDHVLSINRSGIEVISGNFSTWWEQKARRDAFELAQNERLQADIQRLKYAAKKRNEWVCKAEKSLKKKSNSKAAEHEDINTADQSRLIAKAAKLQHNLERRQNEALEEKSGLLKNLERADVLKLRPEAYHAQTLITLCGVSISYGAKEAVRNVNLTLKRGGRIALQGGNGSGKSSILKAITGSGLVTVAVTKPDPARAAMLQAGRVDIGSRLKISYVPQDASYLSGSLSDYAASQEIDETLFKAILSKLDFSKQQFDKDMADFSAGQKKKVLIAASLATRAHVYIWDEPLNYIDVFSRIQIEELILACKPTMIFVEHDRAFCDRVATETVNLVINDK
ncbi:MAG: ABC-F type ribosomal protection protein [Firmicutes bacterium]|nr:ABC-F type ribosomal protection protein [Bacillota bacterium]